MKRKLLLGSVLFMIAVSSVFSATNTTINFKLQVITEGEYQIQKTAPMKIGLYLEDETTLIYEENLGDITTNNLALANLQIGSGTKLSGPAFDSLDWLSTNYKIQFTYNGKVVTKKDGTSMSYLRNAPFVLSTVQTKELLALEAKSSDTVFIKEPLDLMKNAIKGGTVAADTVGPGKKMVLPIYNQKKLDELKDPDKGSIVLFVTEEDTSALYYNGDNWTPFNQASSEGFTGTTKRIFKLKSSTGDVFYRTNDLNLVKDETYKFSMEYDPEMDSLIFYSSSNPAVVSLSATQAKSTKEVTATINGMGFSMITGRSRSGKVVKSFNMYVQDISMDDVDKLYFANIISKKGVYQMNATIGDYVKHVFYAKDLVRPSPFVQHSWSVSPGGDKNRIIPHGTDSATVIFGNGTGQYDVQIVQEYGASKEVISSMKFFLNVKSGTKIDATGKVIPDTK